MLTFGILYCLKTFMSCYKRGYKFTNKVPLEPLSLLLKLVLVLGKVKWNMLSSDWWAPDYDWCLVHSKLAQTHLAASNLNQKLVSESSPYFQVSSRAGRQGQLLIRAGHPSSWAAECQFTHLELQSTGWCLPRLTKFWSPRQSKNRSQTTQTHSFFF